MKSGVVLFLCILLVAFASPQDAVAGNKNLRSKSALSSPTRIQETRSSHPTVSKSKEIVPTSYLTHRSHSAIGSPTRNQKTPPSHPIVPKSSGKVPTVYLTKPTTSPKASVRPTIGTTSDQKPKSPISPGSIVTQTPKSSLPPATTTANSTATKPSNKAQNPTVGPGVVSASKTVTVSNGQTASAQVGWMVVGVGVGGSVSIGGNILHVAGGTEAIIEENSSGQDELSTIHSDTSTTTSTSSSTSSSSASATPYNIFPKQGSTRHQQSAFTRDLERIAQPGSVRRITGLRDKLLLWAASLTPAQASELSRNPVVRGLNVDRPWVNVKRAKKGSTRRPSPNCPPESCSHGKRDGTILVQQGAEDELKMFSQATGARFLAGLPGYAYDSRGGQGITVYVIDSGINPDLPEFRNMPGSLRWLYLPGEPEIRGDESGHGTCVTSKVASPTFGVAKSANIVVVKITSINGMVHGTAYFGAFGVVARDIVSENLQGKAVINLAVNVDPDRIPEEARVTYVDSIRDLIGLDAVFVVSSGNIQDATPGFAISTYPPLLASQFPLVVVGSVDTSGIYAPYSQGLASELTVSAVGGVSCADNEGGTANWEGTSFSAPAVAGLAAYLLSLDQYRERLLVPGSVARNVRDLIKSLAYARLPLQPAAVWNGIDSRQIQCPVRRDTGSSGCPARNTTTLPKVPPATNPPRRSTATTTSTTTVTSSSKPPTSSFSSTTILITVVTNPFSSSTVTDPYITSSDGGESTPTISLTISGISVVATNVPHALTVTLTGATPSLVAT